MRNFVIIFLAMLSAFITNTSHAFDYQNAFLQNVRGEWSGKGEVVAGNYKGTKFSCNFKTPVIDTNAAMTLDGSCRYGIFSQAIKAKIHRAGNSFKGAFNEGAKARGLDIIAGQIQKDQIMLDLDRKDFQGSMTARLESDNRLNITLAVKIDDVAVPFVGVNLTRNEPAPTVVAAKDASDSTWFR